MEDKEMAFPKSVIDKAWDRADGHCETCGKQLVYDHHEEGERGAWEAHHIKAQKDGEDNSLSNCKILCLDCHKNTKSYGSH